VISNWQATPVAGVLFAFYIDLFANGGVAACARVLELNANGIIPVCFELIRESVVAV
jgi:hypothetical protein